MLALAIAAVASSPPAQATPDQDQAFHDAQVAAGIPPASNDPEEARKACLAIESGVLPVDWAFEVQRVNDGILTWEQSKVFVALAVLIYCPEVVDTRSVVA